MVNFKTSLNAKLPRPKIVVGVMFSSNPKVWWYFPDPKVTSRPKIVVVKKRKLR